MPHSADELTTKSAHSIGHPDDLAASAARLQLMLDDKIDRYDAEKRLLHKDGSTVWVRGTANPVRKSDGSIDYIIAVVEDISARKQAEDELRQSEEQFRSSLLLSPLPILVCTENLNPGVAVMESAQDGKRCDAPGPLNRARDQRIFIQ